jgi:hypothetical protein
MVPDLAKLLGTLRGAKVSFVVIGGIAVSAHGAMRATEDIDLVPDPDPENLDRLGNVLAALDARLTLRPTQRIGPAERSALQRGRNLTVTTSLGDLDIVQRLPGVPSYAVLKESAETTMLDDVPLQVCSRAALIAMKRVRASAQDLADIERLEVGGDKRSDSVC